MSNVNDNNLDDLLRRAAEKYPLRTDSANFDKLVADLEKDPSLVLPPVKEDRRKRRFFWLFFLLPLAGGAYYAWHATSGGSHQTGVVREKLASPVTGTAATTTPPATDASAEGKIKLQEKVNQEKDDQVTENATIEKRTADKTPTKEPVTKDNITKSEIAKENNTRSNNIKGNTAKDNTIKDNTIDNTARNNTTAGRKANSANANEDVATAGTVRTGHRKMETGHGNIGTGQTKPAVPGDARIADDKGTGNNEVKAGRVGVNASLASTKNAATINIPVRSNTEEPVKKSPAAKDKIKLQKPKPSFYVGIMGSPDLSVIRFQSLKAVGSNFGLLLGYSFNSRWAVETGIYYDRKKYYTEGEYFSKAKVSRLQDVDLKTVDGVCNMWEIPLNVRYNFSSSNNKMKWFATGGLSTYLMSKEKYTFTGEYWGNPNWHGTYNYNKPYKYWFSILNLSVGYEQRLGKIGNLRLEPFLRVPLAGIGTGDLSIMSAGLNIGITRRIW